MASYFRIAVVALAKAKASMSPSDVRYAVYRCRLEYARSGSIASTEMFEEAKALAAKVASAEKASP